MSGRTKLQRSLTIDDLDTLEALDGGHSTKSIAEATTKSTTASFRGGGSSSTRRRRRRRRKKHFFFSQPEQTADQQAHKRKSIQKKKKSSSFSLVVEDGASHCSREKDEKKQDWRRDEHQEQNSPSSQPMCTSSWCGGTRYEACQENEEHHKSEQVEFPCELAAQSMILNPQSSLRFYWDMSGLVLMLWVLYVTPFEVSFVQSVPGGDILWILNLVVDFGFFIDMMVNLSTAYFCLKRHAWVIDRRMIIKRYARLWLWVDVLSLVRWEAIGMAAASSNGEKSYLRAFRMLRLLRLMRLVRLFQAPDRMTRVVQRFTLSFKQQLVATYLFALLSLLHLEACLIRFTHEIVKRRRDNLDVHTYLSTSFRLRRPHFKQGNFALYIDACDWAFQTLLGNSMYTNTAEGVLSLLNNMMGLLLISFLIGEVANVMCNLDPAKNEFKQLVDALNLFMNEHRFPDELKYQLRLYLAHSEDLFRARFHDNLVSRLSPPLQELVAHYMLGKRVVTVPFFAYARRCTLAFFVGRTVWILPPTSPDKADSVVTNSSAVGSPVSSCTPTAMNDKIAPMSPLSIASSDGRIAVSPGYTTSPTLTVASAASCCRVSEIEVRGATILRCRPDELSYDIEYFDHEKECNVSFRRISLAHEPLQVQRSIEHMNHVTKLIVTAFARAMKMSLYNGGDYVSRRQVSHSNRMFIVDQGSVLALGEDVSRTISIKSYRGGSCFASGELALLAAGHPARLVWYDARATVMTRLLILDGDDFLDTISMPGFEDFFKCLKRFGKWVHFRLAFWSALRKGRLTSKLATPPPRDHEADHSQTVHKSAFINGHHPDHAARINEAMLTGAASTHFERLLAANLALNSRHTETFLKSLTASFHKLEQRLESIEYTQKISSSSLALRTLDSYSSSILSDDDESLPAVRQVSADSTAERPRFELEDLLYSPPAATSSSS